MSEQADVSEQAPASFGARLGELARSRPGDVALTVLSADGEDSLTFDEFERWTNRVARLLADRGATLGTTVVIGYQNSLEHFVATWAGWKCGALVLPLNARAPAAERDVTLELADPVCVLADWDDTECIPRRDVRGSERFSDAPLRDVVSHPGKAVGSGGSTGRPKIIVDPSPWAKVPGWTIGEIGRSIGFHLARVQLVAGPLYHNMPFSWSNFGLFEGQHVLVLDRFDAARALDAIERHRVEFMTLVPTMMRRISEVPGVGERDFSSLISVLHSAAPCPESLKRSWIDLVGAEKLYEGFGATEAVGITIIRGDEWLEHQGSVGRPYGCEVRVQDENGNPVPAGEIGEIFMRPATNSPTYRYIGAPAARSTADQFISVGDMGWVDRDGFVFVADRRTDLIISGGSNVYPAEVEAVLLEHPGIADAVVIGLTDAEWGRRVHAIVQPRDSAVPLEQNALLSWCRERIAPYKVPKAFEFATELPRDEAGKIRRRALVEEREARASIPVEPR